MTRKITRPLYLLLDCNVIIKAYELGIWDDLVEKCQLLVPGTVIEEALYYFDADDNKISIDLSAQVKAGAISEIDPTTEDLFKFTRIFASWFIQTLHPGETEALALFCAGKATNAYFCTSDAPAIRALAIMHRSANGKSFEKLLQENGLTKPLQAQYTERFYANNLQKGSLNLVSGEGYDDPHFDQILKSLGL